MSMFNSLESIIKGLVDIDEPYKLIAFTIIVIAFILLFGFKYLIDGIVRVSAAPGSQSLLRELIKRILPGEIKSQRFRAYRLSIILLATLVVSGALMPWVLKGEERDYQKKLVSIYSEYQELFGLFGQLEQGTPEDIRQQLDRFHKLEERSRILLDKANRLEDVLFLGVNTAQVQVSIAKLLFNIDDRDESLEKAQNTLPILDRTEEEYQKFLNDFGLDVGRHEWRVNESIQEKKIYLRGAVHALIGTINNSPDDLHRARELFCKIKPYQYRDLGINSNDSIMQLALNNPASCRN